jgi:hypothetical protein
MQKPVLKVPESPLDHPDSKYGFQSSRDRPFLATPAAITAYQHKTIITCIRILQQQTEQYHEIVRFQIFQSPDPGKGDLWFIEGYTAGAITALLPSDY